MPDRLINPTLFFPLLFWIFLAFLTFSGRDVSWLMWTAPFWVPAAITLAAMLVAVSFCTGIAVVGLGILVYAVKMSDAVDCRHNQAVSVADNTRKGAGSSVPCEDTSERNES